MSSAHPTVPVAPDQVTEAMLTRARRDAERSELPQTVWPSGYVGRDYVGAGCLLVHAATAGGMTPAGAAGGPLLTVLPTCYIHR